MFNYLYEDSEAIIVKCSDCQNRTRIIHSKIDKTRKRENRFLLTRDMQCEYCSLTCNSIDNVPENPEYKDQESIARGRRTIVQLSIIVLIVLVCGGMGVSSLINRTTNLEQEKSKQVSVNEKNQTTSSKSKNPTAYSNKKAELVEVFNGALGAGSYSQIYVGVKHEAPDTLIVHVNDRWSYLSNDARIGFVKLCWQNWSIGAKARGIDINYEEFKIEIVHNLSSRKVASWDSLWGTSIK